MMWYNASLQLIGPAMRQHPGPRHERGTFMDLQHTTRTCSQCHEVKCLDLFAKKRTSPDGRGSYCKACHARRANKYYHQNRAFVRDKIKQYRQEKGDIVRAQEAQGRERHREKRRVRNHIYYKKTRQQQVVYSRNRYRQQEPTYRNSRLKQMYGLSLDDYNQMFIAQGGVCAVCLNPPVKKRLSVDHDHQTGKVRGLLCASCNFGIGRFKDNADYLERAAMYLRRNSTRPV